MKILERKIERELALTGFSRVEQLLANADFLRAERVIKGILRKRLSPRVASHYLGLLAGCLGCRGKHAEAIACEKKALRLTPRDLTTRFYLIQNILDFTNSCRTALGYLAPILRRPRGSSKELAGTYDLAGQIFLKLQRPQRALKYFSKMAAIKLPLEGRHLSLAVALLKEKIYEKPVVDYLHRYAYSHSTKNKRDARTIKMIRHLLASCRPSKHE